MTTTQAKPGLIQHQLRPEVHAWIKEEARKQERSQRWFLNKLVEDAYARSKTATVEAVSTNQGAEA